MRQYFVYVIELRALVVTYDERREQKRKTKDVYVGSSALVPEARFRKHLTSPKSSRHVRRRGVRLRPDLYSGLNPLPSRMAAKKQEHKLASRLERQGYRVYGSCSRRQTPDCFL